MKKILHTIDTTGPGGAETVFVNLVKGLDRRKFTPVAAITGTGWVSDRLEEAGVVPHYLNSRGTFNVRYLQELVRLIRENRIDLVQSHLLGSNLYSSMAGLICGVPVVSTFHGFVDIHAKERFSRLKSRIINTGSSRLLFVSNRLRDFYISHKGFSAAKSLTLYNGIDTAVYRPERDDRIRKSLGLSPENVVVGSVGNIRPSKSYDILVQAARSVVDKHPHVRFLIAGEGSGSLYENLKGQIEKLGLQRHVILLGFQPKVARFLNNLDLFVLSSSSEGFSISTIEAMACGIPIVATRSGGPEEIITHEHNGLLTEPNDPEGLARCILRMEEEQGLKERCVRNGLARIGLFSNAQLVEGYEEIYGRLLAGGFSPNIDYAG